MAREYLTVRAKHREKQDRLKFEAKQSEMLKRVPQEFHAALARMAWTEGHSNGYSEVLFWLSEYIGHFKPAIARFARRIRSENTKETA